MFGIRSPIKLIIPYNKKNQQNSSLSKEKEDFITNTSIENNPTTTETHNPGPSKSHTSTEINMDNTIKTNEAHKYIDKLTEARAYVSKAKLHLGNSRNLKTEIKSEVINAIDRLYIIIKELEQQNKKNKEPEIQNKIPDKTINQKEYNNENKQIDKILELQNKQISLININNEKIEILSNKLTKLNENIETIEKHKETMEYKSYANITASKIKNIQPIPPTLHSIVITSNNNMETGEEVLNKIKTILKPREGNVNIEKIRKAKNSKIIISCKTIEERKKIKDKINEATKELNVDNIKNKNPLIILKNVLNYNNDEEIINGLKNQNKNIFQNINEEENKIEIVYRKKTKNPHTNHIILRVSTKIWQRIIEQGKVHIDLQQITAEDQSPVIQCSMCLKYGHTKKYCTETDVKCSHCGDLHMRQECPIWLSKSKPSCINCTHANTQNTEHNAFNKDCPIRKKWDTIARSAIAYC